MVPNYRVNQIGFYPDNLYYESGIMKRKIIYIFYLGDIPQKGHSLIAALIKSPW